MPALQIHEIFHAWAERAPARVALEDAQGHLTYGALALGAGRLAAALEAAGAGAGRRVGVLADAPRGGIAALLGALDAGAVAVPIDAAWPEARRRRVAAELALEAILTTPERQDEARSLLGPSVHIIDIQWVFLNEGAPSRPPAPRDPDAAAYVVYTSGSTGQPKGIVGRLGGVTHFIAWERALLGELEAPRVSQLAPLSFDASLRDIFLPLCAGGTICVPPALAGLLAPEALLGWLEDARVEVLHCVPSVFRGLLGVAQEASRLPALRWILMAGEVVRPADVARWTAAHGERVALVNLYGPSETTMTRLAHRLGPEDGQRRAIPIGRPMPEVEVFVVDAAGRPCPPGRLGELVIRTRHASLGYWARPEETARAFVPDLLGDGDPTPVYRTGDLGLQREDGVFEFRGRQDHQIKLRGVRVELEEIEALLLQHPGVLEAAATVRRDGDEERLCAYLVAAAGEAPTADALRAHLARELPAGMLPSAFVTLDALPRHLNGKVDRKALPAPGDGRPRLSTPYAPPATPQEERLAALFGEVLGIQRVGRDDDFFALGGDSLRAIACVWRIKEALAVELPAHQLLRTPTVARLAAALDAGRGGEGALFASLPLGAGAGPPVFWLPPLYGIGLLYAPLIERLALDRPSVALQQQRPADDAEGVEALAAACVERITALQPQGPWTLCGWSFGGVLAFEAARQLTALGGPPARLVLIDSIAPGMALDEAADALQGLSLAASELRRRFGIEVAWRPPAASSLDVAAEVERLLDQAAAAGLPLTPAERALAHHVLAMRAANLAALRRYRPAAGHPAAALLQAEGSAAFAAGWERCIDALQTLPLEGDHHGLLAGEHPGVTAALRALLTPTTP